MRTIYSRELGLEHGVDLTDLEDHATVVVAVLTEGVNHPPVSLEEIEVIWCPFCRWIAPEDEHDSDCSEVGMILI